MRTPNTKKRAAVGKAFDVLTAAHPLLTRTQVIQLLSEKSGIPTATLRYYLRDPKKPVDLRRRYTPVEVEQLSLLDREAFAAEAEKRGITPASLRAAITNNLKTKRRSPILQAEAKLLAELDGHLSWANGFALLAFGLTRRGVITARQKLRSRWGLDLAEPNLLTHEATGRYLELRLPEQIALVTDPINYITLAARGLGQRWAKKEPS